MPTTTEPPRLPGTEAGGLASRLQDYMRRSASRRYEAVRVPPFTAFFHPFDAMVYLNYAIPDARAGSAERAGSDAGAEATGGDLRGALEKLRALARARGRTARFEYVASEAPDLEGALLAEGFRREAEARLMVCTRAMYVAAPAPEGLVIAELGPTTPIAEFQIQAQTARLSFGDESPATLEEAEKARADLMNGRAFLARFEGTPTSVALFTGPEDGIAEMAGVGTVPGYRGRGFGAAIVSRAAESAFATGVDVVFLSTITEEAGRLYERVGFRFLTSMLFCIDDR